MRNSAAVSLSSGEHLRPPPVSEMSMRIFRFPFLIGATGDAAGMRVAAVAATRHSSSTLRPTMAPAPHVGTSEVVM